MWEACSETVRQRAGASSKINSTGIRGVAEGQEAVRKCNEAFCCETRAPSDGSVVVAGGIVPAFGIRPVAFVLVGRF